MVFFKHALRNGLCDIMWLLYKTETSVSYMLSRLMSFLVYFTGYSLFVFIFCFVGMSSLIILFKFIVGFGNISMKDILDVLLFNLYGFSRLSPLIVLSILISKKLRGG